MVVIGEKASPTVATAATAVCQMPDSAGLPTGGHPAHLDAIRKEASDLNVHLTHHLDRSIDNLGADLNLLAAELSRTHAKQLTLLGSRRLYRAFAKVTSSLESALRLEKGRLTYKFLKNAPAIILMEKCLTITREITQELQSMQTVPHTDQEQLHQKRGRCSNLLSELHATCSMGGNMAGGSKKILAPLHHRFLRLENALMSARATITGEAPAATPVVENPEQAGIKLELIPLDPEFCTATHYHSQPTPGRPGGNNPLFYRERQQASLCLKHSINGMLGGAAISAQNLADSVLNEQKRHYLAMIADRPEHFLQEMQESGIAQTLTPEPTVTSIKALPEYHAELMTQVFFDLIGVSPLQYILAGNEIGQAKNVLNEHAATLGLPAAETHDFPTHGELVDFLVTAQEQKDRMILGTGQHYVAFRKADNGDWFKLDSMGLQQRLTPLEFVAQYGPQENLRAGNCRYQFLVFSGGEFVPQLPGTGVTHPTASPGDKV